MTTSKEVDMQEVLKVVSKFMDWSRFKLKSSKTRALVYEKEKVVEWSVESGVEALFKLTLQVVKSSPTLPRSP